MVTNNMCIMKFEILLIVIYKKTYFPCHLLKINLNNLEARRSSLPT